MPLHMSRFVISECGKLHLNLALITPTRHNFQPDISFFGQILNCKRNVRLKIVASGCDQCVWPVGVVAGCGHWVGH